MKTATITVSFDEEKLNALKLYLDQKGTKTEDELSKALDLLYTKTVPAGVREFIDMRSGGNTESTCSKNEEDEKQYFSFFCCGRSQAGGERE